MSRTRATKPLPSGKPTLADEKPSPSGKPLRSQKPLRGEKAQATLELAFCLPIVVILYLFLVQIGVVLLNQLAVTQAAREGARAAAVDPNPGAAAAAAGLATGLDSRRLKTTVGPRPGSDGMVHVTAEYESDIRMPLTQTILVRTHVEGHAAMRVETDT